MIAQTIATRHPDRVRTLTSIASAPAPRIGQRRTGTLLRIAKIIRRRTADEDAFVQQQLDLAPFISSAGYPVDEEWIREMSKEVYRRGYDLAAVQRQTAAIAASVTAGPSSRSCECRPW